MPMLVIVISAFKHKFLTQTLLSLENQSCKDFLVFVGDDAGHPNIETICREFSNRLQITYLRFESNLGGKSLTRQWERCITMTKSPWIMLLGDDDTLDPACVEKFYETVGSESGPNIPDLYRFNTRIIDHNGVVLRENPVHKKFVTTSEFLESRFSGTSSYVVEFIFSRHIYNDAGGFVDFPLAWCSDDATWTKFSINSGIRCIEGPKVSWRLSGDNISSANPSLSRKKIDTNLEYLKWLKINILVNLKSQDNDAFRLESMAAGWFLRSISYSQLVLPLTRIIYYSMFLSNFSNTGFFRFLVQMLKINWHNHRPNIRS